jgi:hypothetical protein
MYEGRSQVDHGLSEALLEDVNAQTRVLRGLDVELRLDPFNTPLNLVEERVRAITALEDGALFTPTFVYKPIPPDFESPYEDLLRRVDPARSTWHGRIAEAISRSVQLIQATRTRRSEAIADVSVNIHGRPSAETLSAARQILADRRASVVDESTVSATEAATSLRVALERARLGDWAVRLDSAMQARMSVQAADQVVRVNATASFTTAEVDRLVIHELGTHVVRGANGFRQPLLMAGLGFPGYLSTEEGLACWNEARFGLSDPTVIARYAVRALAADLALSLGFAEVFAFAADALAPADAFAVATRAKRGVVDCGSPGGDVKDHVYLSGMLAVDGHLRDNPADTNTLFSGKIGLSDLPDVRQLVTSGQWVDPPALMPDDFLDATNS